MDILSYLTTLIKTHKAVGIPGLGTIYKKKSPGRYDIHTHSFLPPSYSLAFTSDLSEQSLLINLISSKKNISTDAATYFVEQFSQNILDELSSNQESKFGEIGTFSTTSGSLTFIPKKETNFGFDFYGLPALKDEAEENKVSQITPEQLELENNNADLSDGNEIETDISKETSLEEAIFSHLDVSEPSGNFSKTEQDEQPVYEEIAEIANLPSSEQKSQADPIIETPPNETEVLVPPNAMDEPKSVPSGQFTLDYTEKKPALPAYLKVIIGVVILTLLAGILYVTKPELFSGITKSTSENSPEAPKPTKAIINTEQLKLDSVAQLDSIRRSNEMAILAADSAKDSMTVTKPAETTSSVTYEIIAASLLNQKEADRFLADMKRKGIAAKVADMPGRRVKISIGSFTDEETAKKELEILKKTTKIPGIYIYPVRHTNNSK